MPQSNEKNQISRSRYILDESSAESVISKISLMEEGDGSLTLRNRKDIYMHMIVRII